MTNELAVKTKADAELLERVVVGGDLSKLTPQERMRYYAAVCESVGLNPFTQPFQYLYLQNKMTLYARKEATEQLREIHGVSVTKLEANLVDGIYTVTAYGQTPKGRTDAATGSVAIETLHGQEKANACMKAETKAKRRLTLSLCGLGMLDESEVDVPEGARVETEVIQPRIMARAQGGDVELVPEQVATTLFPDPEEDRKGLIQRARVAGARLDKKRVGEFKKQYLGSVETDYETCDLAALVALVQALEQEKL